MDMDKAVWQRYKEGELYDPGEIKLGGGGYQVRGSRMAKLEGFPCVQPSVTGTVAVFQLSISCLSQIYI